MTDLTMLYRHAVEEVRFDYVGRVLDRWESVGPLKPVIGQLKLMDGNGWEQLASLAYNGPGQNEIETLRVIKLRNTRTEPVEIAKRTVDGASWQVVRWGLQLELAIATRRAIGTISDRYGGHQLRWCWEYEISCTSADRGVTIEATHRGQATHWSMFKSRKSLVRELGRIGADTETAQAFAVRCGLVSEKERWGQEQIDWMVDR